MPTESPKTCAPSRIPLTRWHTWALLLVITVAAIVTHSAALLAIHHVRGSISAYAFQSPDAAEYVALARGLAWTHHYVQLDSAAHPITGPDTWRTPGYPLFLALAIRLDSDSPRSLLCAQQFIAIASVPLLAMVLLRLTRPRWAVLASLAWCFDPFRVYYSLWLLSETLFTFVLILACWYWLRYRDLDKMVEDAGTSRSESRFRSAFILGILSALLVLIRPIALPLPLIAVVGVALAPWYGSRRRHHSAAERPKSLVLAAGACLLGASLTLAPWLLRIHHYTGHIAISQQSGASLVYHKVVDVVLWSQGRARYRFDTAATTEIREIIDTRLRHEWLERFGHLTPGEADSLRWENLNFGKPLDPGVDPFVVSGMLWSIGTDMLVGRMGALIKCFTVQGALMLAFPLGLVLWPPANAGAAPLSTLLGGQGALARLIAADIGSCYLALTLWVFARVVGAVCRRRTLVGAFAFWPAAAMFIFSLPFEDPRFRLPLIPLFWILAASQSPVRPKPPHPSQ